ncbi:CARDB domain-containing protein [Stieleria neptunia]|nr:CARDB domain-containing protein [Stieleria neptunia]
MVRITLLNKGSKGSEPCRLLCVVKKIGTSNVARQKHFKVQPLTAKSSGILIIHLDDILPKSVRAAETTFKLMVDSQKTISESNENNNVHVHTGASQPDLRIVGFVFPAAGPSTATEVKIANIGSSSSSPCRLLLTVGEIEGTKVNRKKMVAVPKLNGMQATVVTVDAASILPGGVALSKTHFRLTVDATKHVDESNEQNNNAYHKP